MTASRSGHCVWCACVRALVRLRACVRVCVLSFCLTNILIETPTASSDTAPRPTAHCSDMACMWSTPGIFSTPTCNSCHHDDSKRLVVVSRMAQKQGVERDALSILGSFHWR